MSRLALILAAALTLGSAAAAADVPIGDDGLHKPGWLKNSFKDLREDAAEAAAANRTLLILIEQRGCIYCAEMHEKTLSDPVVEQLIRDRFDVVQIDLFGGTEVTDTDGEVLTEKRMAGKWGVSVTPTLIFLGRDLPPGVSVPKAAMAVLPGAPDAVRAAALLEWAAAGGPATGRTLAEVLAK